MYSVKIFWQNSLLNLLMSTFLGLGHSLDYQKSGLQIKYGQTLLGGFILQIRFICMINMMVFYYIDQSVASSNTNRVNWQWIIIQFITWVWFFSNCECLHQNGINCDLSISTRLSDKILLITICNINIYVFR